VVPKAGGTPVLLATAFAPSASRRCTGRGLDRQRDRPRRSVRRPPLGGGCTVSLPWGRGLALGLAVISTSLYWTTSEGAVMRLPIE
jgi:hypothetical protein